MPDLRRAVAHAASAEAARADELIVAAEEMSRMSGHALSPQVAQALHAHRAGATRYELLRKAMLAAGMYWITEPMARVAMEASQDVPSLTVEDAPDRSGMLVFASPLPPYDTSAHGGIALRDGTRTDIPYTEPVPVDAIAWHIESGALMVWMMCRRHRLPLPLSPNDAELIPFSTLIGRAQVEDLSLPGQAHSVQAFLAACWVLMMMPSVAERTGLDGRRGRLATRNTKPADLVTTVDLRPMRTVVLDREEGTGRRLKHRHIVRGHWTNQPYGPGQSLRRKTWRAPYVKGPEGAPLVEREQVFVWRR